MKIIWTDHEPSWGVPDQEELKAEVALAREFSRERTEKTAQEKSSQRERKGFG